MKNQIIKGTFILSGAGLITRIIGFYYRIFLSKRIGATGMGLYQMIFPVFGLCYSLSVAGIQMSISRFTAVNHGRNDREGMYTVLKLGLLLSLSISVCVAAVLYFFSDFIAVSLLDEPRCGTLIKILSLSIPLGALHSCIGGYFLGKKEAHVPAVAQLFEQLVRVGAVYVIAMVLTSAGKTPSPVIAVVGLIFGDAASALISICFLFNEKHFLRSKTVRGTETLKGMFFMALPISLNRITGSLLVALEAILIPICLKKTGMTSDNALAIYGVLMGMAMPLILFPSTITASLSAMIMPSVAEYQSAGRYDSIGKTASKVIKYCLSIGIFCAGYFYLYGKRLGEIFFSSSDAGLYISVLSWLCPFLYLAATLGSILNGMGKTNITFFHNLASTLVRLVFIIFLVPSLGIKGCLIGILVSHILCSVLHAFMLYKEVHFFYDTFQYIIKPLFVTVLCLGISLFILHFGESDGVYRLFSTLISVVIGCIPFIIYILADTKKNG